MRGIKKFIALLLAVVLLLPVFSLYTVAETEYKGYPIVLVPGYASASLCYEEDGETSTAWGWKVNDISGCFFENITGILKSLDLLLSKSDFSYLAHSIGNSLELMLEPMECNPDGTSVKAVRPVLYSAEETCDSYLNSVYPEGDYRVELDMTKELDSLVGEENVYYFNCDFRMSAIDCAKQLDDYIQQVKENSNCEKVNLIAVSHGGLITSTYLALFKEKCDVYNVCMNEPALAGAGIAVDMMKSECDLDVETLVRYLQYHSQCEYDFEWFFKADRLGIVDDILEIVIPYARDVLKYWGSIWDFIPVEDYEQLKKVYLIESESAELIEKSDFVHYEVMANYKTIFEQSQKLGIRVNIIAGTGNPIVTGMRINSDGIIPIYSSTGATCAPYGKRFGEGYVASSKTISPAMDIDASTCYLPNNTWFVNGLFHGMEFWDEYSKSLLFKLLLTDEPIDIYTDKNYPRFHDTTSVTGSVYAEFDNSGAGFISTKDRKIYVTNLSDKYPMLILSVKSKGVELDFDLKYYALMPGESRAISFNGNIPKGITYSEITITYALFGSITPLGHRKQYFTAVNGESNAKNESNSFVDNSFASDFESQASERTLRTLDKLGLSELTSTFYDAVSVPWRKLVKLFI